MASISSPPSATPALPPHMNINNDDETTTTPEFRPYKEFLKEFRLGRVIGTGGFGEVRKCKHKKSKVAYALKTVAVTDKRVEKYEAAILSDPRLQHNHIVKLQRLYKDESNVYLLFDFCAGGDVLEYMERVVYRDDFTDLMLSHFGIDARELQSAPSPETIEHQVGSIIAQLLRAVRHCHDEVGVVHRDIKPSNILVRDQYFSGQSRISEPYVKLVDFGMSRRVDDECTSRGGTIEYVAPEVLDSRIQSDDPRAADVWSVGVVAYTLLFGQSPFRGRSRKETKRLVCQATLEFPELDEFSKEAKDFILMLLDPVPQSRPTAAQALRHEWLQPHLGLAMPKRESLHNIEYTSTNGQSSTPAKTSKKESKKQSKKGLIKSIFSRRKRRGSDELEERQTSGTENLLTTQ